MRPELTIVIPTLRERENIAPLAARLNDCLGGVRWEAVFVDDDSRDGTIEEIMRLADEGLPVRFLSRLGRRGLSSACIEGMASSGADFLAVMDADLQHDETLLPRMLERLRAEADLDLVVGTRYVPGGSVGEWKGARILISRVATWLEKLFVRSGLSDPMSGFFMLRRGLFERAAAGLSGRGFKILLDLVLSAPTRPRVADVAYEFRARLHGESKLDVIATLEYLHLLADKRFGKYLPVDFVIYGAVGCSGLVLHLAALGIMFRHFGVSFVVAQSVATIVAMISNFFVNNSVTFRPQRLRGMPMAFGAAAYLAICGVGAGVNVRVAASLNEHQVAWWLAGAIGAGIGAVWNYAISSHIVWSWMQSHRAPEK